MKNNHLSFDDGWKVLEQGILACSKILQGSSSSRPTVAEYMNCYDCVYRMAVQKPNYCEEMYNGYKVKLAECVRAMVLPHLLNKSGDHFLRHIAKLWSNYCLMVKCIAVFFSFLSRCFVELRKLPCLEDVAATSFFGPVFSFFNHEITDALLTMIRQERDGCKVDTDLLMGIMRGICRSEVKETMKNALLQDTHAYYSIKSSEWILQYPLPDYLAKAQDTMEKEVMKLTHYLCISKSHSSDLCLQAVSAPLMQTYASHASEKCNGGGHLLLQTNKTVDDDLLARCSRLTISNDYDNSSVNHME